MRAPLSEAIRYWDHIAPVVKYPENKKEFNELVRQLDELLDLVGSDEDHSLMGLVDAMSYLVAAYEEARIPPFKTKGVDALKFLMSSHGLSQSSFPEVGSQGVLSEILNGRRAMNVRQIKFLAEKFGVNPVTFIDN